MHGVFAVRSPSRPNPIGLTAARVAGIEGLRIAVDLLDFTEGTPVIDIKPYFVTRDMFYSARNAPVGQPASRAAMRESLRLQAVHFHGEEHADVALAVRVIEHYRAVVLNMVEPLEWTIVAPLGRPRMIDALMGMTRVSPGRGTLLFHDRDSVRIAGRREYFFRRRLLQDVWPATDEDLFEVVTLD